MLPLSIDFYIKVELYNYSVREITKKNGVIARKNRTFQHVKKIFFEKKVS